MCPPSCRSVPPRGHVILNIYNSILYRKVIQAWSMLLWKWLGVYFIFYHWSGWSNSSIEFISQRLYFPWRGGGHDIYLLKNQCNRWNIEPCTVLWIYFDPDLEIFFGTCLFYILTKVLKLKKLKIYHQQLFL